MEHESKLAIGAIALGLAAAALTLGTACGSTVTVPFAGGVIVGVAMYMFLHGLQERR